VSINLNLQYLFHQAPKQRQTVEAIKSVFGLESIKTSLPNFIIMTGEIVLITGGSGHLGYRVLVDAIEAGYNVRAAVRAQDKAQKILNAPSIQKLAPGDRLQFVIVPDMLVDGAYNDAIQGAAYVIHVASPITSSYKEGDDMEAHFVGAAVRGTMNVLEAAQKTSTVKRVVITSSVVGIISWKDFTSGSCPTVFNEKSRTPFLHAPYANVFEAYAASKVKALKDAEDWQAEGEKKTFDLVHIFPGFIIGRDELVTDIKDAFYGTNNEVLKPITGGDDGSVPSSSIHLRDVSLAHVKALDPKVPGNRGYVLSCGGLEGTVWEKSLEIVAREFPSAIQDSRLANNGKIATLPVKIDESNSAEVLGMRYLGFEEQVKNVVEHYLELLSTGN
jgi:nucleoside-diphosphate-sugar epimerase